MVSGRTLGSVLAGLQHQIDAHGQLDWALHFVYNTIVRAHQQAVGAKEGTWKERRSGAAEPVTAQKSTSGASGAASRWR